MEHFGFIRHGPDAMARILTVGDLGEAKVDGLAEDTAISLPLQHKIGRLPIAVRQARLMQLHQRLCRK